MWMLLLAATLGCEQTRDTNILTEELPILSAGKTQAEKVSPCPGGFILNGNGAGAGTIAEAAILIERALDPDETVRNPVKSEHVGERRNLRQSTPLDQL